MVCGKQRIEGFVILIPCFLTGQIIIAYGNAWFLLCIERITEGTGHHEGGYISTLFIPNIISLTQLRGKFGFVINRTELSFVVCSDSDSAKVIFIFKGLFAVQFSKYVKI